MQVVLDVQALQEKICKAFLQGAKNSVFDALRDYLTTRFSARTRQQIAESLYISESQLSGFMNKHRGLSDDILLRAVQELRFPIQQHARSPMVAVAGLRNALESLCDNDIDLVEQRCTLSFAALTALEFWGRLRTSKDLPSAQERSKVLSKVLAFHYAYCRQYGRLPEGPGIKDDEGVKQVIDDWGRDWELCSELLPFSWPEDVLWSTQVGMIRDDKGGGGLI